MITNALFIASDFHMKCVLSFSEFLTVLTRSECSSADFVDKLHFKHPLAARRVHLCEAQNIQLCLMCVRGWQLGLGNSGGTVEA